ncbi:serine hydrolase FSH [Lophiotrema nucula]|uniref:Serine hydrolase FSH n=1 Tax=Lophiotrema nucula TaxID=690887 RepID=A0A6A5YG44_9PLEO|nr:serine hydrolase FSH [Lophiotrema nucula]
MRFLCLHGQGTSSQVLEVQLSAVQYQLGDGHTYEFVEGTVPESAAPEIQAVFSPDGQYFGYFAEESPESCLAALNSLDRYLQVEGPFDGLIAFSQGGALASTLLVRQNLGRPRATDLKVAIFFSGGIPVDPVLLEQGVLKSLDHECNGEVIRVPTAHVMGRTESGELQWPSKLVKLCRADTRDVFHHEGGHEIPGIKDRAGVTGVVQVMRRAMWRAQAASRV